MCAKGDARLLAAVARNLNEAANILQRYHQSRGPKTRTVFSARRGRCVQGQYIASVSMFFDRAYKGLAALAPVLSAVSQRDRNIRAEGAHASPFFRYRWRLAGPSPPACARHKSH